MRPANDFQPSPTGNTVYLLQRDVRDADIRTFAARGNMSPGQRAMATTMLFPKTQSLKRKGAGSVAATDQGFSATSLSQARSAGR